MYKQREGKRGKLKKTVDVWRQTPDPAASNEEEEMNRVVPATTALLASPSVVGPADLADLAGEIRKRSATGLESYRQ
jgi:hypothetical protein